MRSLRSQSNYLIPREARPPFYHFITNHFITIYTIFLLKINMILSKISQMLSEIKFWTDDEVWRGILTDLGAEYVSENIADVVVGVSPGVPAQSSDCVGWAEKPLTPMELKAQLIAAMDAREREIMRAVFGRDVALAPASRKMITILEHAGDAGVSADELRAAFGYSANANTHAVETAISALRREWGADFIVFENGKYKLRKV